MGYQFTNYMKVKDALKKLEKDNKFKEWKNKNKEFFITNAFIMIQDNEDINNIQIGYCNKKENKITSFIVSNDIEEFSDKIFKEPNAKVLKIDINNVNIDAEEALNKANKFQKTFYPTAVSNKKILLLQNKGNGEIWNITFITNSLEVLHFNIDSKDGELLMHEKSSLLQFRSN